MERRKDARHNPDPADVADVRRAAEFESAFDQHEGTKRDAIGGRRRGLGHVKST